MPAACGDATGGGAEWIDGDVTGGGAIWSDGDATGGGAGDGVIVVVVVDGTRKSTIISIVIAVVRFGRWNLKSGFVFDDDDVNLKLKTF